MALKCISAVMFIIASFQVVRVSSRLKQSMDCALHSLETLDLRDSTGHKVVSPGDNICRLNALLEDERMQSITELHCCQH